MDNAEFCEVYLLGDNVVTIETLPRTAELLVFRC